jgi:hypothetical protein
MASTPYLWGQYKFAPWPPPNRVGISTLGIDRVGLGLNVRVMGGWGDRAGVPGILGRRIDLESRPIECVVERARGRLGDDRAVVVSMLVVCILTRWIGRRGRWQTAEEPVRLTSYAFLDNTRLSGHLMLALHHTMLDKGGGFTTGGRQRKAHSLPGEPPSTAVRQPLVATVARLQSPCLDSHPLLPSESSTTSSRRPSPQARSQVALGSSGRPRTT